MGGKLNVYNLGEKGVNTAKTPLHHEDGEFLSAQNAEFYAEAGLGGLHKRPGLQRFNTEVLASALKGVIGVPLPGPGERAVHVYLGAGAGNLFKVTEDATTWATADGFAVDVNQPAAGQSAPRAKAVHLLGQFFWHGFAEHFGTGPPFGIFGYDGEMEYELARSDADATHFTLLGSHNGKLIVSEGTASEERVWLIDPLTGEKDAIGLPSVIAAASAGTVTAACSFLGKVWIGCSGVGTFIFYAREGELNWTQDHTNGPMGTVASMLAYEGKLYVGYSAASPTQALIESRTSAGVWATEQTAVITNPTTTIYDTFVIHQSKLYVSFNNNGNVAIPDPNVAKVYVNDSGSWSLEKDFSGDVTGLYAVVGLLSVASTLFAGVTDDTTLAAGSNGVYKKVGSGSWTLSYNGLGGGGGLSLVDAGIMGVI